jgi:hypothetical protein
MKTKDTVIGTAKQIVAEIVGDGTLAEEGSRQAGGNGFLSTSDDDADFIPPQSRSTPSDIPISQAAPHNDEDRFAKLLGHAALKVWSNLPREAQECLFATAVDDGVIANSLIALGQRSNLSSQPVRLAAIGQRGPYRPQQCKPSSFGHRQLPKDAKSPSRQPASR